MPWTTPGTATAGDVLTAAFWNTQVRDNMIELAPFSAAWTSYTPTFSGVTVGNGTNSSAYVKVGKLVCFRASFTLGSTSAVTGQLGVTLPFTARVDNAGVFSGYFLDSGSGWSLPFLVTGTTTITLYASLASGTYVTAAATSSTIPFTWSTNDIITVGGVYEAL